MLLTPSESQESHNQEVLHNTSLFEKISEIIAAGQYSMAALLLVMTITVDYIFS